MASSYGVYEGLPLRRPQREHNPDVEYYHQREPTEGNFPRQSNRVPTYLSPSGIVTVHESGDTQCDLNSIPTLSKPTVQLEGHMRRGTQRSHKRLHNVKEAVDDEHIQEDSTLNARSNRYQSKLTSREEIKKEILKRRVSESSNDSVIRVNRFHSGPQPSKVDPATLSNQFTFGSTKDAKYDGTLVQTNANRENDRIIDQVSTQTVCPISTVVERATTEMQAPPVTPRAKPQKSVCGACGLGAKRSGKLAKKPSERSVSLRTNVRSKKVSATDESSVLGRSPSKVCSQLDDDGSELMSLETGPVKNLTSYISQKEQPTRQRLKVDEQITRSDSSEECKPESKKSSRRCCIS